MEKMSIAKNSLCCPTLQEEKTIPIKGIKYIYSNNKSESKEDTIITKIHEELKCLKEQMKRRINQLMLILLLNLIFSLLLFYYEKSYLYDYQTSNAAPPVGIIISSLLFYHKKIKWE